MGFLGRLSGRLAALAVLVAAFSGLLYAGAGKEGGRTPLPAVTIENGGKCVRDTGWMRRNHMTLLMHQRDDTMYQGVRGTDEALRNCIDCHASSETGSVIGSDRAFCQGCHTYAAVSLDCWDCHNPKVVRAGAEAGK